MTETKFIPDWADLVEYKSDGPNHKILVETATYKSVIVGLEKGQAIPPHPAQAATYHFLQGSGRMMIEGQEMPVREGATVVVPEGVPVASLPTVAWLFWPLAEPSQWPAMAGS